jgi:hypothetical protein
MQIGILIVISILTLMPGHATLSGTWALDRVRSDFGAADAPKQFVVRVEQTGSDLAVTLFTVDFNRKRLRYLECRAANQPDGVLSCVTPDGVTADEKWQVTGIDQLTITRVIAARSQTTRQRLVLARSSALE